MNPARTITISSNPLSAKPQPIRRDNWVSVVSHLDPKYGGLSAAVPALGAAVHGAGEFSVSLAGFCVNGEYSAPAASTPVKTHYMPFGYVNWLRSQSSRSELQNLIKRSTGVHIHGLWEQSTLVSARLARSYNKPYLMSAHGMLEPWALKNKRVRKAVYAALVERANLRRANCLHALTRAEAADYRAFGLRNPIAVIPNGVEIPLNVSKEAFLKQFPRLRGQRLLMFLSRIHFKKGLDMLCRAWASVAPRWPDSHLVLAGPDFENTQSRVESLIEHLGIKNRVTLTGMLKRDLKWSALKASECFVLPSYSEGLSVAVLEAMGVGVPVLITKQCNLPEVESSGCGWVIEPRAEELAVSLENVLSGSAASLGAMGANGQRLVAERYSWPVVGEQMSALYSWLQGGPYPATVEVDSGVSL